MKEKQTELSKEDVNSEKLSEEEFWLNKFEDNINKSILPIDYPCYTNEVSYKKIKYNFDHSVITWLNNVCDYSDIKLHIFLSSALFLLIKKFTFENDISLGTLIHKQEDDSDLINKVLVLKILFNEELTCRELLFKTKDVVINAYKNQNYSLDKIIKQLKIVYSKEEFHPLFDIALIVEGLHDKLYFDNIKFNILFSFIKENDSITCEIKYNSLLYKEGSIETFFKCFQQVLFVYSKNFDTKIRDVELISTQDKCMVLQKFNNTEYNHDAKSVIDVFKEKVKRNPKATAVIHSEREISYEELDRISDRLAGQLIALNVKHKVVAVHLSPSIELVIVLLGVLKSGGVFLPIDVDLPEDRKRIMLNDSNASKIITSSNSLINDGYSDKIIDIQNIKDCSTYHPISILPNDNAYVMYTSGTTGYPKAAVISHKGLSNYIIWAKEFYIGNEEFAFPLFTSISFDLTLTSIFVPLISGNTIHVYYGSDPALVLKEMIEDNKIDIIKLTPTHIKILNNIHFDLDASKNTTKIKKVIVGGEQINAHDIITLYNNYSNVIEIFNEYGPTETVVGSTVSKLEPKTIAKENISIGGPINNTQIFILDSNQKMLPIGAIGEVYIGGGGVSKGYLNNVMLTSEKFVVDPFKNNQHIYKTGDLARWLPDGRIEFLGRIDSQVKIRGYRIELNEIEKQLLLRHDIKEAVVTLNGDNENKVIVAYYIADKEIDSLDLKSFLAKKLPEYMLPLYFVPLDHVPVSKNGKINKKALPDPGFKSLKRFIGPSTKIEEEIQLIWSEILEIDKNQISVDENFTNLGGHSLKATVLVNRINRHFLIKIPLKIFFTIPTVKELALYIEAIKNENQETTEIQEEFLF